MRNKSFFLPLNAAFKSLVPALLIFFLAFSATATESYNALASAEKDDAVASRRLILTIDGGGIRGLLPALLLKEVEDFLTVEMTKSLPRAPYEEIRLGEAFDLLAGTSTGGLIVLGLNVPDESGRPLYPMKTFVELYQEKGQDIFPSQTYGGWFGVKYTPQNLETLLRETFKDFTLRDLLKPTLITAYDIHKEDLFVFNSEQARHSENKNYGIVETARSTSAAPTYFPAFEVQEKSGQKHSLIDGGVAANNPAHLAYIEAQKLYPNDPITLISLGCGISPLFTLESKKNKGKLHWAGDIAGVLMNTTSHMSHNLMDDLTQLRGDSYIRVQFKLDQAASQLDNATDKNIQILQGYAKREMSDPHSPIHKVKNVLLRYYQERGFYLHFPLIEKIETQLREHPHKIDLSSFALTERALWEIMETLKKQERYLKVTEIILDKNKIAASWVLHLENLKNLKRLSLRQIATPHSLMENFSQLNALKRTRLSALTTLDLRDNPSLQDLDAPHLIKFLSLYDEVNIDPEVEGILGDYYATQRNDEKAISHYRRGEAYKPNALALISLLLNSTRNDNDEAFNEGFERCKTLAEQGDAEAQYTMGHLYARLESKVKDYLIKRQFLKNNDNFDVLHHQADSQAGYYYHLAAAQHHKKAALALGTFYRENRIKVPGITMSQGAKAQLEGAAKYYKIAAEAGSVSAENLLNEVAQELKDLQSH